MEPQGIHPGEVANGRDHGDDARSEPTPPRGPNPRVVFLDDLGRLSERDGTILRVPGLEPAQLLEGLADSHAGRYRPLREIIAGRREDE